MSEMITRIHDLLQRRLFDEPADDLIIVAREIIEAMKEPTDEMMVAAENAEPVLSSFAEKAESPSYRAWQAMLTEALRSEDRGEA
jgi:hypothetical protein